MPNGAAGNAVLNPSTRHSAHGAAGKAVLNEHAPFGTWRAGKMAVLTATRKMAGFAHAPTAPLAGGPARAAAATPDDGARGSVKRIAAYRQQLKQGDTAALAAPPVDDATELEREAFGAQAGVEALILQLAEENPALEDVLKGAVEDLGAGRRLFERAADDEHVQLRRAHVSSELMRDGPIAGVTLAACAALCEALRRNESNTDPRAQCEAYAFRRLAPEDDADLSVSCELLSGSGVCSTKDFSGMLYTRKYTSSGSCKNPTRHSNPFCLALPSSREDARVLTHEDSKELCAQKPDGAPANGGKLPTPRSALEVNYHLNL